MTLSKMYCFGYRSSHGHCYMAPHDAFVYSDEAKQLIPPALIDSGFCPPGSQVQGPAMMRHHDGWTVMSFWDRSGDHRGNSNTNFLYRGKCTFEEMCALAAAEFPEVWGRLTFKVTLHGWAEDKPA